MQPSEESPLDFPAFQESELAKRRRNVIKRLTAAASDTGDIQLFCSHSWRGRDPKIQNRKFEVFSSLTTPDKEDGPGMIFWADFLDLQAEGPVPWRGEIEEAIQNCSKMVCFVDMQYLLSFNCLQELAHAIEYNKPLVILMMDQEAWDTATAVDGYVKAWETEPKSGIPLSSYEGQELIPGKPFSQEVLRSLFAVISSINFCACRELDVANLGATAVAQNVLKFIEKDLDYAKEHAALQQRASHWLVQGSPNSLLMTKLETTRWSDWTKVAKKSGALPAPTKVQLQYVQASKSLVHRNRRVLQLGAVLVLLLIFAGGIGAGIMAVKFKRSEALATENEQKAKVAKEEAIVARNDAVESERNAISEKRNAIEARLDAERARDEAEKREKQAAVLLLSTTRQPKTSREVRAVEKSAEVAMGINDPGLVLPAMHAVVKFMTSLPYVFWELEGHKNWVRALAFNPRDSNAMVSGDDNGMIRVWRSADETTSAFGVPKDMRSDKMWCGDSQRVRSLAWDPMQNRIAAGTDGHNICLFEGDFVGPGMSWAQSEGSPRWVSFHQKSVRALAFSPDGSYLASGGDDETVMIWNMSKAFGAIGSYGPLVTFKHPEDVRSLAWSPVNDTVLATGCNDAGIRIFHINSSAVSDVAPLIEVLGAHDDDINSIGFSSDGKLLATGSDDATVKIWELDWKNASLALKHTLSDHNRGVRAATWSPETDMLATAATGGPLFLYRYSDLIHGNSSAGGVEPAYELDSQGASFTVARWSPDGSLLATGTSGDKIRVWRNAPDLGDDGPQALKMVCAQKHGSVRSVAWTTDGLRAATGSSDDTLCIWERQQASQSWDDATVYDFPPADGHPDPSAIRGLAWSLLGSMIAAADDSGTVTLWKRDNVTGFVPMLLTELTGNSKTRAVAFSSDERYLAAGCDSSKLGIWQTSNANFTLLKAHRGSVRTVAWSLVGHMLASGGTDKNVIVWNLTAYQNGTIALEGEPAFLRNHTNNIRNVEWSPYGRLASASDDNTIRLWDHSEAGWKSSEPIKGHSSNVRSVTWSRPDGDYIASSSLDRTMRIWQISKQPVDDLGQSPVIGSWKIEDECQWSQWLETSTVKLACAKQSEESDHTWLMEMMMVDFEQQRSLLQQLSYGCLTEDDLKVFGYNVLSVPSLCNDYPLDARS